MKSKKPNTGKTIKKGLAVEKEVQALKEAGEISAKKAIQESKALNLSITFLEGNTIYREGPDGKREKIAVLK